MPLLSCYPQLRLPKSICKAFDNAFVINSNNYSQFIRPEHFCTRVLHSPSLGLKDKHRVFSEISSLSPMQYDALMKIFCEEQEKFLETEKKDNTHSTLIITCRSLYESLLLSYLYQIVPKDQSEKEIIGKMVFKWLKKDNKSKEYCATQSKKNAILRHFLDCRNYYCMIHGKKN